MISITYNSNSLKNGLLARLSNFVGSNDCVTLGINSQIKPFTTDIPIFSPADHRIFICGPDSLLAPEHDIVVRQTEILFDPLLPEFSRV
jgi:hypothetical protein